MELCFFPPSLKVNLQTTVYTIPSRRLCALARIFRVVPRFYELCATAKHHEIVWNKPEARNQELKIPLSNSKLELALSLPSPKTFTL
jgi:hypothetical protein